MPALALPPSLGRRWGRATWAIALLPVVFALLTSADLAPFFAAMAIFAPEAFALLALPLLLFPLVRRAGRVPSERLGLQLATGFGSRLWLLAAAGSLADFGLWLWILSAFVPEIALSGALLMTVLLLGRRLGRFAAALWWPSR